MPPALRFTLITLLIAVPATIAGAAFYRATGHSDPQHYWVAGVVGLTLGLMAARKRCKQDTLH